MGGPPWSGCASISNRVAFAYGPPNHEGCGVRLRSPCRLVIAFSFGIFDRNFSRVVKSQGRVSASQAPTNGLRRQ